MGIFTYSIAGGAFIMIGAWESLRDNPSPPPSPSPPTLPSRVAAANEIQSKNGLAPSSSVTFVSIATLSLLFVLNSLASLADAHISRDQVGVAFQLEVIAIALLFLTYSVLGLLTHVTKSFKPPSALLNVLSLCAFAEEFIFFYFRRKDPDGIENRYYDLFLVPIGICVFCTILELKDPKSSYARLGRGVGLISQGLWIVQMGFSFFTDAMARGCSLQGKSRGNYTIRCKGHPEYHRGRAIATLQFNCHLAFLATLLVVVFGIVSKNRGIQRDPLHYRPLGAEMQGVDSHTQFTLDSDDDENGIEEERSVELQKATVPMAALEVNGHGTH